MPDPDAQAANTDPLLERVDAIMAHAWMVRTFVKHSPEVEDFPELMHIVRTVFDVSRALEVKRDDPAEFRKMLRKKIGKLRQAAEQFRIDAPKASDHTNFKQAVISFDGCVRELEALLGTPTQPPSLSEPASVQPSHTAS